MPPFSKNLAEEGVLIRNFKLLDARPVATGRTAELLVVRPVSQPLRRRQPGRHHGPDRRQPARREDLRRMIERYSLPVVQAYMRHIQDAAERKMRAALGQAAAAARASSSIIWTTARRSAWRSRSSGEQATIDFTGTGPVSAGNLNANRAIVTAAVMYVLRLLIDEDIPLNQGVLAPVEIILPECLLNPPRARAARGLLPAVVGGNVETSQRVVDVLLGALGLAAASQGTMNNLLFGDDDVRLLRNDLRRQRRDGRGRRRRRRPHAHDQHAADRPRSPRSPLSRAAARVLASAAAPAARASTAAATASSARIEFLRPLTLSILSQRRGPYPPYGLAGGQPGALGKNTLQRVGQTFLSAESLARPRPNRSPARRHPHHRNARRRRLGAK